MKSFTLKIALAIGILAGGAGLFYRLGLLGKGPPAQETLATKPEVALAVRAEKVRSGDIQERLSAVGSLLAHRAVELAPKTSGRLEAVLVEVGDLVKAGKPLARLDGRELFEEVKEAEAALKVVGATLKGKEAELEDLKRKLERANSLLKKNFISRQEVDTLESQVIFARAQVELASAQIAQTKARLDNARIRLADTEIVSPLSGYVGKRYLDPGALVSPSTPVVSLVDISAVKAVIPVAEADFRKLHPGMRARATVDAYPGRGFVGRVARVAPVLNQETRTGQAEIELVNPGGMLKPGMFAKVELSVSERQGVMLVPSAALVKTAEGYAVYKVEGEGSFVRRVVVKPGLSDREWTQIQGKLAPGDRVVTVGSHLVREGQRVGVEESSPSKGQTP